MSAPSHHLRQTEHISYGFLAVNSVDALNKLLQESQLTERDQEHLKKAAIFLTDIADGADLVTNASYRGHNSLASMKAFDVAIGPLEQLRDLAQDEQVVDTLRQLSACLLAAIEGRGSTQQYRENYEKLALFFTNLNQSLMREMVRSRQSLRQNKQAGRRQVAQ